MYFPRSRPSAADVASTFTEYEALLREEAGLATLQLVAAEVDETATRVGGEDCRAGRGGPVSIFTFV